MHKIRWISIQSFLYVFSDQMLFFKMAKQAHEITRQFSFNKTLNNIGEKQYQLSIFDADVIYVTLYIHCEYIIS